MANIDDVWRITANKDLHMLIKTEGLPSNLKVYIDNIHIDTSIVSTNAYFDGILQDTMDDRIHNSLMLGFPISDTISYFGTNEIEGQNTEFIEGSCYAYNGTGGGSVTSKRYLESNYLEKGCWANKISAAIGLLIEDVNTGEIRGVDVKSDLQVKVNNRIDFVVILKDNTKEVVTYEYDKYGNKTEVAREPYTEDRSR